MLTAERLGLSVSGLECAWVPLQARVFARLHGIAETEIGPTIAEKEWDDDDIASAYDVILGRE